MRITTFIILAACLHVSAGGFAQKLTIHGENLSLKQVFAEIKKQAGYVFMVNDNLLVKAKPVTIYASEATVGEVLTECMKGQPLTFEIVDKTVFIKEKLLPVNTSTRVVLETTDKEIPVKGRVTDENGQPVSGVTVSVKGTKKATATNANGEFSLPAVNTDGRLIFTGANIETSIINVESRGEISIQLKMKVGGLDEVQVIAYGSITKRLQTGNVTTIKAEDIEKQPINNPLLALEGRVPGLFITQTSGLPGTGISVRIQGQNSILSGNDPFYVIDGIPYSSQMLSTVTGGSANILGNPNQGLSGNPLNYINPSDIESIEVLKDADATAIYGSRAANGAILITTKKGKAGKTKTDLNFQNGWQSITRNLKVLNTKQYLEMRNEALTNDALIPDPTYDYDLTLWDTTRNTNWQKKLLNNPSHYDNITGTISGGTTNTQYLLGGTYHYENTVFPGRLSDQKGAMHMNLINTSEDQKFHIQISANYMVDNNQLPYNDYTFQAITLPPDAPSQYKIDGTLNWMPDASGNSSWNNPASNIFNNYKNKTNNLLSSLTLGYHIFPNLEIKSNFGYTNLQTNEFQAISLLAIQPEYQPYFSRTAYYTFSTINTLIAEPQLIYKFKLGKAKIETLIGTTVQQNKNTGVGLNGKGYISDAVLSDIHSAANVSVTNSTSSVYNYNALFGRINYNWKDKYIINLILRRDGSSRFGELNQFHNFGSAGVAWIFSEEPGIKNNFSEFSFGKIKCTYGVTGNDQIGDYRFMSLYSPLNVSVPYQNTVALISSGLPNPYLQWEETRKMQFGLDLGFFQDKLLLSLNYSQNRSSNQLLPYQLPLITGYSSIIENFPATVQNRTWELALTIVPFKSKSFNWHSTLNLTLPSNKLIAFPNLSTSTYSGRLVIGQPISIIHALHFAGVNTTDGSYQFIDSHGKITSDPNYSTDMESLVNTLPKLYGGLQNTFTYKKVRFDVLLQFVKQIGTNYFFGNYPGQEGVNQPTSVLTRWRKTGDKTSIQRYNSDYSISDQADAASLSDAAYSDASFIRLKTISLSYDLPLKLGKQNNFHNCQIYIQGQNLLTITSYRGMDPENQSISSLPPLRIFTIGIQATL